MDDSIIESQDIEISQETPADDVFIPPSIHNEDLLGGRSYTHYSAIPEALQNDVGTECVLGVDEAGRGPVIGILSSCYLLRIPQAWT